MNLLLDTHVVIWFITDDKKLPQKIKSIVENTNNSVFVSLASLWEMAIKHSLKKLTLKSDLKEIFQKIQDSGIEVLPISPEHILESSTLPFHHRDPFDRMLIAQTTFEGLQLVSKDNWVKRYEIAVIW